MLPTHFLIPERIERSPALPVHLRNTKGDKQHFKSDHAFSPWSFGGVYGRSHRIISCEIDEESEVHPAATRLIEVETVVFTVVAIDIITTLPTR